MTITAGTRMGLWSSRHGPGFRVAQASGSKSSATTSATVPVSTAIKSGDQLLIAVSIGSTTDTVATPTGWALQAGPVNSTAGSVNCRGYLFSRTADGTEGATVAFTKTGTTGTWQILLAAFTATAGVDVVASAGSAASSLAPVLPSVTPTTDYGSWVGFFVQRSGTTDTTPPAGFSEALDAPGTSGIEVCRRAPILAGATGTATGAFDVATNYVAFSVALKHT